MIRRWGYKSDPWPLHWAAWLLLNQGFKNKRSEKAAGALKYYVFMCFATLFCVFDVEILQKIFAGKK